MNFSNSFSEHLFHIGVEPEHTIAEVKSMLTALQPNLLGQEFHLRVEIPSEDGTMRNDMQSLGEIKTNIEQRYRNQVEDDVLEFHVESYGSVNNNERFITPEPDSSSNDTEELSPSDGNRSTVSTNRR